MPGETDDVKIDETKGAEGEGKSGDEGKDPKDEKKPEVKYTDEDLNRIIGEKIAKERQKFEQQLEDEKKSMSEAQKLDKMTKDEKTKYELEKLQKENAELKERQNLAEQMSIARKELADLGTPMPDALLTVFVSSDADKTKASIDEIKKLWPEAINKAVKEALKGTPPPDEKNNSKAPSAGASYAAKVNEERVPKKGEN